jgi:two-component sensor histidine kinase
MPVTESNQTRFVGDTATPINATASVPLIERTVVFRYGCAILSTLVMTLLRMVMNPWLGSRAPFGLFFVAVVFTSWIAGFGPGLFSILLGTLIGVELAEPQARFALSGAAAWVGAINFVLTSIVIVLLNERQRRSKAEADLNIRALHAKQGLLEQKQVEVEALNARLQRAMQETHHRVKNNLQVVTALTELQVEPGAQTVPATAIQRIGSHLQGLATIHDLLTQTAHDNMDFSVLHAGAILDKLVPLIVSTSDGRQIRYTADDVMLSARQGTALAILVNELASNALKHGSGDIQINLKVDTKTARLEVCDQGAGFPAGFDPRAAANTGLELVDSVGRWDLRGVISYGNQPEGGARVTVTFPVLPESSLVPS